MASSRATPHAGADEGYIEAHSITPENMAMAPGEALPVLRLKANLHRPVVQRQRSSGLSVLPFN